MVVEVRNLVLCTLLSTALLAQSGSLGGQILDAQKAAVSGAEIEAVHQATTIAYRTTSSAAGLYLLPQLPPGTYTVRVQKTGFQNAVRAGVEIFGAQRQPLDWQLTVGDTSQRIDVSSAPTLLDTNTSERGQTLTPRLFDTLPRWAGGLQDPSAFLSFMAGVNSTAEVSIAGSNGRAREQLIDGGSNVIPESGGTVFNRPSAESFQEVRLLVGGYSAEYGRVGGGIEIFTTKSGTNEWHGTFAYHLRRDIWRAAGWAVNQNRNNPAGFRPKDRANAASGGFGGPIRRNQTFIFLSTDHDLQPVAWQSVINTVATPAARLGDFTRTATPIFDLGAPFPNNIIPPSRLSRVSTNLLTLLPAPTGPGLNNNYTFVNTNRLTDHVWALKLDHALGERQRFAYFHSWQNQAIRRQADFAGPLGSAGDVTQRPRVVRVQHTLALSPTMVLQSIYGYSRTAQLGNLPEQTGGASRAGFPGITGTFDVTPRIQFTGPDGFTNWGSTVTNRSGQDNYTHHFAQTLSRVHGRHLIKAGGEFRRLQTLALRTGGNANGTYSFARAQTALPTALATTGNSFASFLLGLPDSATLTLPPVEDFDINYRYLAFFVQDDFKLTPRLTLNLGFRYEIPVNWNMRSMSSVSLTTPNPAAGNRLGAYVFPEGASRFWPTDYSNLGPRLGFAYQAARHTVLRGGFGIVYQATGNGGCGCNTGSSATLAAQSNGLTSPFIWDNGIPRPAGFQAPPNRSPAAGNGQAVDYLGPTFGRAPRIFHWSLGLQRELGGFLLKAEYAGNRGYSLNSTVDLNQVDPSYLRLGPLLQRPIGAPEVAAAGFTKPYAAFPDNVALAQALRPYPQYLNVFSRNSGHGRTWYDAASFELQRRIGAWQFNASYVRSKSLGLLTFRQIFTQNQVFAQDMYNLSQPKSHLPFDLPNAFNFLSTYDLPFGRGRRYLARVPRLLNAIAGDWTIAQAHNYRSGGLLPVLCLNTLGNGVLFTSLRACDVRPGSVESGQSRTSLDPNQPSSLWFNAGAFALPGQFAFGSSAPFQGRFRQPPVFTDNLSLSKEIYLWESVRVHLSANAFNVFNRTNFAVNGTVGNPNFGRATVPQQAPRIVTLGLRMRF